MVISFSADRIMCNNTICQHEGTCIDEVDGSYYCQCKIGYDGIHCEIDTRTDTGIYIILWVRMCVCMICFIRLLWMNFTTRHAAKYRENGEDQMVWPYGESERHHGKHVIAWQCGGVSTAVSACR